MVKNSKSTIHISGQLGINVETGKLVQGGLEFEFKQIMKNMEAILSKTGGNLEYLF